MKTTYLFRFIGLLIIGSILFSCGSSSSDSDTALSVTFKNDNSSEFAITAIQLRSMGRDDDATSTVGEWGANILSSGDSINPGDHRFFSLDIPGGHWSECRLGVNNGTANIMLHEQADYADASPSFVCSITHWGSDARFVSVTVVNPATDGYDAIILTSISDMAD